MKKPPAIKESIGRGLNPFRGERAAELVPQARLTGPMPWVIAIMVSLTVIAAAGGLALSNIANSARTEIAGGVTVQIMEPDLAERDRQTELAERLLGDDPVVASLRRVPKDELDTLLEPWLGVGTDNAAVPIPTLIDLRLREDATEDILNRLRGVLATQVPAARLDAQSSWLAPVFSAIQSLKWLSAALAILLGITSAAAVWLAARSALGANKGTIEVVHLLGGTDRQIARIFERSIGFDATLGGAVGLGLGLVVVLVLGRQFVALGSGMMAGGTLGWLDWVLIASVPIIGVVLAMLTARFTVLATLRRML